MGRHFILFFINLLFLSGWQLEGVRPDSLSDDEAAIATNIKALHDGNSEVREAAAEVLRRIIAKYPSGTSNIRSRDGGEAYWMERVSQIKEGMTKTEVVKILPPLQKTADYEMAPNGDVNYRVDNNWIVTIPYRNSDKVISSAKLIKSELLVFVTSPEEYTGTWTNWYINGQKCDETQYENGRYNGLLTHFYDNGQESYKQHYINGVPDGPGVGWYREGQKMYAGQYRNGKQEGKWIHWFSNGEKQSESNFKDGVFDGLWAGWYENGQMRYEMNYKDGVQHGMEAGWDERGVLQYQREYKNGRVVE
jgi:antitoxin component YwqK of YwqJK toxin-antitoxin module